MKTCRNLKLNQNLKKITTGKDRTTFIKVLAALLLSLFLVSCSEEDGGDHITSIGNEQPVITKINFTSPEAQNLYKPGEELHITWNHEAGSASVILELYRKSQKKYFITNGKVNDGTATWYIPKDIDESRHYRVKISLPSNPDDVTYSDYFYILSQ